MKLKAIVENILTIKNRLSLLLIIFCTNIFAMGLPNLHTQNGNIYDQYDRIVVLHGVNEVNKQFPYLVSSDTNGFSDEHIRFIETHGFNVVRLGIYWSSIEPTAPHHSIPSFNDTYLAQVKQMVQLLAKHQIYTLLDFHNDGYDEKHGGGLGAPDWVYGSSHQKKIISNPGFPLNDFGGAVVNGQIISNSINSDNDIFWQNKHHRIQDQYINMIKYTVKYMKGTPGILGYDPMNEPSPGSMWHECGYITNSGRFSFATGCHTFDLERLTPFYANLITQIKQIDPKAIVWYEQNALGGMGSPSFIGKLPVNEGKNIGFNFHNYWSPDLTLALNNAVKQRNLNHTASLMSEFDANTLDHAKLNHLLQLADQANLSWIIWTFSNNPVYKFSAWPGGLPADPTRQGLVYNLRSFVSEHCETNNACSAVNWDLLREIDRPYPQYIAGTNPEFSYDISKKVFTLNYNPSNNKIKVNSLAQTTQIYLPRHIFKHNYKIIIHGAKQLPSSNPSILLVENNGSSEVSVTVSAN